MPEPERIAFRAGPASAYILRTALPERDRLDFEARAIPAPVHDLEWVRDDRFLLGHPRGLGLIFVTEMWERFSYYGMRAILVLYLVNALRWDTARAAHLYGTYTMLV